MTEYYISPTGADSADGLSPETAWQHHPWQTGASGNSLSVRSAMPHGSFIYMERGAKWHDVYIANGNDTGITTTTKDGFGSGADPILSAAFNPSSLTWLNPSGTIYSTVTVNSDPNLVIYNDTILTKNTTTPTTPGASEWGYSADTLYVNVGENPTAGELEACRYNYVILTTASQRIYSNLVLQCSKANAGGALFVNEHDNVQVYGCTARFFHNGAGFYGTGCVGLILNGCEVYNSMDYSKDQRGVQFGGTVVTSPRVIDLYAHDLTRYPVHNIVATGMAILGGKISNCGDGINIENDFDIISGLTIDGIENAVTTYAIRISSATKGTIANCKIKNCSGHGIYIYACSNIVCYGHKISGSALYGLFVNGSANIDLFLLDFTNNRHGVYISDSDSVLLRQSQMKYCYERNDDGDYIPYPSGMGSGVTIEGSSSLCEVITCLVFGCYTGIGLNTSTGTGGHKIFNNWIESSKVNGISNGGDPGVVTNEIAYNGVIVDPAPAESGEYTGHGICTQVNGKKTSVHHNYIKVMKVGTNCNGEYIIDGGGLVGHSTDYNHIEAGTTGAIIGKLGATTSYDSLSNWVAAIQTDSLVSNLDGVSNLAGLNDTEGPPIYDPLEIKTSAGIPATGGSRGVLNMLCWGVAI